MKPDTFYMMRKDPVDLLRYLPKFLPKDETFKDAEDTLSREHEAYRLKLVDIAKQFWLETATWSLPDWERFLGITPKDYQSFELRKAVCRVKLRGLETMTVENTIRLMEEFMTSGFADVEELGDNEVRLILDNGVFYWDELFKALWEFLPAHLGFSLKFNNHCEEEIYPAQITQNCTADEIDYAETAPSKNEIYLVNHTGDCTSDKIDYDFDLKIKQNEIYLGWHMGIGGYELIDAEKPLDDFDADYWEVLYKRWQVWSRNPVVKVYSHHFPLSFDDGEVEEPEEYYSGNILKLYFKHSDGRIRIVPMPHPRDNITGSDIKTLGLWVGQNKVLLNSRKKPAEEIIRAVYITKNVERIL